MKIREKSRALSVLECVCHVAFVYPIIAIIWNMFVNNNGAKIQVALMVAASEVLFYILRRRLHKRWVLYAIIVVSISCLSVTVNYVGGIYLFAGIVMSILCMIIVWTSSHIDFEAPSAGVAVLLFIIGIGVWLASVAKITITFYICEAIYVFALLIYKNLKKADDFIWENRRTAFLSVGQIKNANYLNTFILGVIILAVASISALLFSPILNLLKEPILKLLTNLFGGDVTMPDMSGIAGGSSGEIGEAVEQTTNQGGAGSVIAAIFLGILGIISIIMLIAFVVHIIRQLSSGTMDGDIREYIVPFHKEDISSVEQEAEEKVDDRPAKKIRKIYKKKIKSNLKKNGSVPKSSTPDEQKKLAGLSGEGTDEFMELYHKARYSNEECTEDDVEKMKSYR